MIRQARLRFHDDEDRWYVQWRNQSYPLSCGTSLALRMAGRYVPCRLELSHDWYIITAEKRFVLHPKEVYDVKADL